MLACTCAPIPSALGVPPTKTSIPDWSAPKKFNVSDPSKLGLNVTLWWSALPSVTSPFG